MAVFIINAADQSFNGAAAIQNDNGAFADMAVFVLCNHFLQDLFGFLLQILVKRGADVYVLIALADVGVDLIINHVGKMMSAFNFVFCDVFQWFGCGLFHFLLADGAVFIHQP